MLLRSKNRRLWKWENTKHYLSTQKWELLCAYEIFGWIGWTNCISITWIWPLARKIEEDKTLIIDFSYLEIKYRKRANQSIYEPSSSSQEHGRKFNDWRYIHVWSYIISLIPSVLEVPRNMDHADDFISVLDSLSKGLLSTTLNVTTSWRRRIFKADYCRNNVIWPNVKRFLVIGSKIVGKRMHTRIHAHSEETMETDYHVIWVRLHIWHNYSSCATQLSCWHWPHCRLKPGSQKHSFSACILYSTNHVYLHRFSRLWFCVCV